MAAPKDVSESLSVLKMETEEESCWHVFTEEILPRLPGEDLQKLKSVCKYWLRIISSPYFVGLHLDMYNRSRIRVVIQQNSKMMIKEYKYKDNIIKPDPDPEITQIPYPPPIQKGNPKIVGSCKGLLCFLHKPTTLGVFNPSTRKYFSIKIDINYTDCFWFGEHPSTGEYVLVWGMLRHYKFGLHKLSRASDSTYYCISRTGVPTCPCQETGTLLHGAVHWPVFQWINKESCRHMISAYHLNHNKYLEISPPAALVKSRFTIGVNAEGRLFAVFKPNTQLECKFEIWIMQEYGVQQSWTKYANIEGFDTCTMMSPLGFFPNGDLILDVYIRRSNDNHQLIKYSFNDSKGVLLVEHGSCGAAFMCEDSLVSPNTFI